VIVKQGPTFSAGRVAGLRPAAAWQRKPVTWHLAALALLAVLMPLDGLWAVQVLLVPLLLIIPGVILLRALRVPGRAVAASPVYVPCASLIVLLASGLVVDLFGPLVGVTAPLRPAPLLIGLELICVGLIACSVNAPAEADIPWRLPSQPMRLAWPLVLPLVAAAGALRLNNGYGNTIAVIALVASVVCLAWAFCSAPRLDQALLAVIIYAAGLALMWSFSLRSSLVYGFDIADEYYSMHQTVVTGVWHTAHPNNAYGAMLAVTVLPAELHALSGMQDLLVFKVAYPAIGALFPVAVYGLARRVLERRWAFTAAAFVVMQATFFQELPALARQEISMVLFAALIAAVLDIQLPRRSQWGLVCLLALGMVASHYSTTYLAIPLLGITAAVQWGLSWLRAVPRVTGSVLVAFAVALAGAFVWYGPVTHMGSNLTQFAETAESHGIDLLPNSGGNPLSTYLQGESSQQLEPAQYEQVAQEYYKVHYPFMTPLPDARDPQYALRPASVSVPPVTWTLGYNVLNLVDLLVTQLTNLLAAIGALMIVLRRDAPVVARQVGLLSLAALVILAVTRVSGTVAQAYNPERAFLQTMIVLAITLCWPMQSLVRRWRRLQPAVLAVSLAALTAFLVGSAGLTGALLGGGTATNLANSGADYEEYYVTTQEIASAMWLIKYVPPGQLVYADDYAALRLVAVGGDRSAMFADVTPLTIDQHAWVYASQANIVDKIARSHLGTTNYSAIYAFPIRFLDLNYDTVYTDGSSEVFHR
jgi:uncharacterized membrane protein